MDAPARRALMSHLQRHRPPVPDPGERAQHQHQHHSTLQQPTPVKRKSSLPQPQPVSKVRKYVPPAPLVSHSSLCGAQTPHSLAYVGFTVLQGFDACGDGRVIISSLTASQDLMREVMAVSIETGARLSEWKPHAHSGIERQVSE